MEFSGDCNTEILTYQNTGRHKKTGTFEKKKKIEEIREKKFIDRN
jgi:hypothetical protein